MLTDSEKLILTVRPLPSYEMVMPASIASVGEELPEAKPILTEQPAEHPPQGVPHD